MKKALIFDLDNTLIHSDLAYADALEKLDLDLKIYDQARSHVKKTLNSHFFPQQISPQSRNRLIYFKVYLKMMEQNAGAAAVLKIHQDYENLMLENVAKQWAALGRDQLFLQLSEKRNLYILTNENLRTQLSKLAVMDPSGIYFKGVVTSEEFGFEKPKPEIYRYLLSEYKIDVAEAFMVGDDVECDITPALSMGLKAVQTTEFKKASDASRHRVINDLNKVLEFA